jgi:hypothetical protein
MEPGNFPRFEANWKHLRNEVLLRLSHAQPSTGSGRSMRGIVVFAMITALMAVVDAAFFQGRHLKDGEEAILGLASLSTQIGRR